MSLLKRSYFQCQSCECQRRLKTDTGNTRKTDTNFVSKSECEQQSSTSPELTQVNSKEEFRIKRGKSCNECAKKRVLRHYTVSGRGKPCMKFVWNKHMLKDVEKVLHSDWILHITHGYIGQCSIFLKVM